MEHATLFSHSIAILPHKRLHQSSRGKSLNRATQKDGNDSSRVAEIFKAKSATPVIANPSGTAGVSNSAAILLSSSVPLSNIPVSNTTSMDSASVAAILSSPAINECLSATISSTTASNLKVLSLITMPHTHLTEKRESDARASKTQTMPVMQPPLLESHEAPPRPGDAESGAAVPEPSESAAPCNPMACHIFEASVQMALLDFSI